MLASAMTSAAALTITSATIACSTAIRALAEAVTDFTVTHSDLPIAVHADDHDHG